MNFFVELAVTIYEVIKAIILGVLYSIIPAPQKSVDGQVVLITGAGSGIGRLMSLEFAKKGAIVVGWDISAKGNEETKKFVEDAGFQMHTFECDISKRENVYKSGEQVMRDIGNVDILINNAGMVTGKRFLDCPDDMIVKTMEVNTLAHFWTLQCFLPEMLKQNRGHVVAISSMLGVDGISGTCEYSASKSGVIRLMESIAMEMHVHAIKTTTVCPFIINTGFFKGCSVRFPSVLPVLQPEWTARRIVTGILTNQKVLFIPRIMYLMVILKALLPVDATLSLHRFFGASTAMDNFVGRKKDN
ncbi:hypothetical protein CAPTEDRAFT_103007 [Capitella teleta]|uniref:Short-chain dehydrogenase/reductase 3 n=1 Tax=Capitella teleta TaxID=283909 RepID=R7TLH8_CAPTE|nr:hypothetical protein CAPTEDRAFT_103007 [Capitella teleta]|eukprot:ELT94342.1 hypothetical protein CAPTEDRAFT_103007 [Capitella teleta]